MIKPSPIPDNFINIPFTVGNLDRFVVRQAILSALNETLDKFTGEMLDIGCGQMPYKDYIKKNSSITNYTGLDIETAIEYDRNVKPDITWDGHLMPFQDGSFDCIMATEVLEHCPDPQVTLREAYRVLSAGGIFFFTTPFLWNLHEVPHDEYRFTPFSLERHLRQAGFCDVYVKATGGWHASMAQMIGLWVRRSPLSSRKKKIFSFFAKPVMKQLLKMDFRAKVDFRKAPMITTLYGTARKEKA